MLGNLFRSNSSQRTQSNLDSVTDDAHTRNLLFGHSQQVYTLSNSPPASPLALHNFRPSSFDDCGGLDLDDKDVRVLLAQDAVGGEERPTMLFDSRKTLEPKSPRASQTGARVPLPSDWKLPYSQSASGAQSMPQRNRGSTISGAPWSRPMRDLGSLEDVYLSCMFGSTSATKLSSSTKMHVIPAEAQPQTANIKLGQDGLPRQRRAPLSRSETSGQAPTLGSMGIDRGQDTVLITRLFRVTLPENVQIATKPDSTWSPKQGQASSSPDSSPTKRPKLVERKVPIFAIGLVIRLPHPKKSVTATARAGSSSASLHRAGSASSSYGSELQSSWTFLDAIPASLASSKNWTNDGDHRVEAIVNNWDIILRGLRTFENVASAIVKDRLLYLVKQLDNADVKESKEQKIPKEKSIQRINQRMVSIPAHSSDLNSRALTGASDQLSRRIARAIKMPRVVTGIGLSAGHWTDESRFLYRACGTRQHNFFLLNLLTAFLGHHTEWLERLAPSRYRRSNRARRAKDGDSEILPTRTVLISDQKGLARRLIYVLASFLPGDHEDDGLHRLSESMDETMFCLSSPSKRPSRQTSLRRRAQRRSHGRLLRPDMEDKVVLSTSASSLDSNPAVLSRDSPLKPHLRTEPNKVVLEKTGRVQSSFVQTDPKSTTSAVVSADPVTPTAYIAPTRTSYFPETAVVDVGESVASADLSKILHRAQSDSHRRSSSVSSRWGSLVSGLSDLWSNRSATGPPNGSISTASQEVSPARVHNRTISATARNTPPNPLEAMVGELDSKRFVAPERHLGHQTSQITSSIDASWKRVTSPQLHVDQEDGVIDVDLKLPGFISWPELGSPSSNFAHTHLRAEMFSPQGSSSLHSTHSFASHRMQFHERRQINVGGYLSHFHQDLALQAVKDYEELEGDIKNAMSAENTHLEPTVLNSPNEWQNVCSTLVANTKTSSIRRLTLRRRTRLQSIGTSRQNQSVIIDTADRVTSSPEEEFVDETVMEFDNTIVEALERLLGVDALEMQSKQVHNKGHSRQTSASASSNAQDDSGVQTQSSILVDSVRSDQRHVVVGALERIIQSVDDSLTCEKSTQMHPSLHGRAQNDLQQNILREGVKNWLLNIDQTRVW